jgi:protein O-mannosyl-transferase
MDGFATDHGKTVAAPPAAWSRPVLLGAILAAGTFAAYAPAIGGAFIWDDDAHVTKAALRSVAGLGRIWFELGATQQYYPVLHSAFWLEHRWWGDSPLGYHLANVALHALAAGLFGLLLGRLRSAQAIAAASDRTAGGVDWIAAAIFALHPVGVESVAWIAEQKNTLSAVFYLLAALAYLGFNPPDNRAALRWPYYGLAFVCFGLAVLSKTVTATLPAALLVVLWWQRGRLSWRREVGPLLPWFGLGVGAGLFNAWVERVYIGAHGVEFALTFPQRCVLCGRAIWFYAGKLLWPTDLVFIYPRWTLVSAVPSQWLGLIGAGAVTAALWAFRRRARGPLAGWLVFVGTLFPALGFFNVYPFIFSYVADHFQYLASMGLIALAAGACARIPGRKWRVAVVALLLGVLASLTWRQCRVYRDAQTLYEATLERNPDAWLAHLNLGNILLEQGRLAAALAHYRAAEGLEPDYPSTHFNLGRELQGEGQDAAAIPEFGEVLRLNPADAEACNDLGVSLANNGRWDEAKAQFEQAVRLRPDYPVARANLARVEALQAGASSR